MVSSSNVEHCGGEYNSGVAFWEPWRFRVERCRFDNLSQTSSTLFGGVCLHCDTCTAGSAFECFFLKCSNQQQPSVFVRDAGPTFVLSCCFIESMAFETGSRTPITFRNCYFDALCNLSLPEVGIEVRSNSTHVGGSGRAVGGVAALVGLTGALLVVVSTRRVRKNL
jgi:hypothetical protein